MRTPKKSFAWLCGILLTIWWTSSRASADSTPATPSTSDVAAVIGSFDGKGKLSNPTEKTYRLPDIGVYAAYYPTHGDLATGMSVELYDRRNRRGLFNWFKYDMMVSDHRLGLAIGRKLYPVIDLTVSVVYSRDFQRDEHNWGLSVGLVKF